MLVHRATHGRAGRACGHDPDAGSRHIRIHGLVTRARTAAGERGERVVPVHRAERQGGVRGAGGADRPRALLTVVARGHHEQGAGTPAEVVQGQAHRVGAVAGARRAEAHVDDVGALLHRPFHARDHLRRTAETVVTEHLADQQPRTGRHAPAGAAGPGADATAADDGRHVSAVPELVCGGATA